MGVSVDDSKKGRSSSGSFDKAALAKKYGPRNLDFNDPFNVRKNGFAAIRGPGANLGKRISDSTVDESDRDKLNDRSRRDSAAARLRRNGMRQQEAQAEQEAMDDAPVDPEMSFADYLRMARGMMSESSGSGTDYSALEGQLRDNAGQGDAKLEAMFRQLGTAIAADAPIIQKGYTDAGATLQKNADTAAASSNAGYDAARAGQSEQLKALGIEQAAGTIANKGTGAAQEQGRSNANIQETLAAAQALNTQKQTSSLDFNRGVGNAAQLEGATQRATLQQQLAQKLAELRVAQSEETSARSMQNDDRAWSRASDLADWDNKAAERRMGPSAADEIALQMDAASLVNMNLRNENAQYALDNPDAPKTSPAYGANLPAMQSFATAWGLDPNNPNDLQKVVDILGNR